MDHAVHYDYLRQLLRIYMRSDERLRSFRAPLADTARAYMTSVLKSLLSKAHFRFELPLVSLFWRIIADVDFESAQTKVLLHALRSRNSVSAGDGQTLDSDPILVLHQALLDGSPANSWAHQEACSVLHDTRAWEWLKMLAGRSQESSLLTGANSRLSILLALRHEPTLLDHWWSVWMKILGTEARSLEHRDTAHVDRAILLAFLRLAALYRSSRVVFGAERLLTVLSTVKLAQDEIQAAETLESPNHSLSVAIGAAYACMGTSNLVMLLARLQAAGFKINEPRLPHAYLTRVVQLLLKFQVPHVVWDVASQVYANLPADLVGAVAHACAKAGHIAEAASLLTDVRLDSGERHRIATVCLGQLARQCGVLTRRAALNVCEALGRRTSRNLRYVAVRMALNAGLVRLAGKMGARWRLPRPLERMLAVRLVKARLPRLALRVVDRHQSVWVSHMLRNAGYRKISGIDARQTDTRVLDSKNDATRRGNIYLIRSNTSRRRKLGGRARLRATLTALARLLRCGVPRTCGRRVDAPRAPFQPDAVTLNIILCALAQSTLCISSDDFRALFDLLSRYGRCGRYATGNQFGTEPDRVLKGFASSALALVALVPGEGLSFVRHVRPLLKIFGAGFRLRGDQEGVKVVRGILRAEYAYWTRASGSVQTGA